MFKDEEMFLIMQVNFAAFDIIFINYDLNLKFFKVPILPLAKIVGVSAKDDR